MNKNNSLHVLANKENIEDLLTVSTTDTACRKGSQERYIRETSDTSDISEYAGREYINTLREDLENVMLMLKAHNDNEVKGNKNIVLYLVLFVVALINLLLSIWQI